MDIFIPPLPRPVSARALEVGPVSGRYPAVWHISDTCALHDQTYLHKLGAVAHAHGLFSYGLICMSPAVAEEEVVWAHEYAHLLVGPLMSSREWSHGPRWRKALTALGFQEEADEYIGWKI